jgi:hypothetical protein
VVAILAGGATSPRDAPVWVHGAAAIGMGETGVAAIGMAAIGVAAIGMAATGMVETGVAVIGMVAIGTTGMGIGVIIDSITASSSLVTSAFRGGGAGALPGAGAVPGVGAVPGATRTVTTGGMAIRTATAAMVPEGMDTVITATVTAMDMATALTANTVLVAKVANTALRLTRE